MLERIANLLEGILRRLRGPIRTPPLEIPGITTASIYTSGDAFGSRFEIPVPVSGMIESLTFYDFDDEGVAKDLFISPVRFDGTADHDPFAITDAQMLHGDSIVISAGDYTNFNNNQLATVTGIQLPYEAPEGKLYCQMITRGTDTIAAGNLPQISLGIR